MTRRHAQDVVRHRRAAAVAVALAMTIGFAPSAKAGLLDELFGLGGARQQAVAPAPAETAQASERTRDTGRSVKHVSTRKRTVATGRPNLQKPTTIMADKTLRPGDAVMSEHGLEIYAGPVSDRHERSQFVALAEARLPQAARIALADKVPVLQRAADTVATGRSVVTSGAGDR